MASKKPFRTKPSESCPKAALPKEAKDEEQVELNESVVELDSSVPSNKFVNDGSFLEMFKRMQESKDTAKLDTGTKELSPSPSGSTNIQSVKRRKVLKTGIIKRERKDDGADDDGPTDSWTKYMTEVKRYKEMHGDDSDKNRPLVK